MYEYEFRDRLVSGTYRDAFRAPAGTGKPHRVVPHRQVPAGDSMRKNCARRVEPTTFSNRLEALEIRFGRLMIGGSGRSSAPNVLGSRDETPRFLPIRGTNDTERRDPVSASEPQKRLGVPLIYEFIKWHWFSYQDIGIQSRIHQTAAHRDFEAKSYALVMLAGR
ncbi:hypothetical protein ALC53_06760 [Atta colombica]|uniref:Uncharacterized protein n=1 Tax=Atta colombica TaxID=520822 RepID=A0A151I310_9HYME|nr:hypothetical protein ALC53_06760 [Atta colombica]